MQPSPAPANPPVIEMRGVAVGSMRDASLRVAEQVNWTVAPGDYWVVAALRGAGKSDFLMTAAGLMGPVEGSYRFYGEEMPLFDEGQLHQRLRLGIVFDGGQLLSHLTVGQNVALPLRYHHNLSAAEAEPQVRQMLQLTGLEPWADSTPGTLGRQWKKRAGLARALMLKPSLLLLDDPLSGLDPRHLSWWQGFLDRLCKGCPELNLDPVTLVATTSDPRPWENHARQFAALRNRRLGMLGAWEQLCRALDEQL